MSNYKMVTPQRSGQIFLEMYNLPRLNQGEIKNMNLPITTTNIKSMIKNHPPNCPWPDDLTGKFY